jgi:hypothetical protein
VTTSFDVDVLLDTVGQAASKAEQRLFGCKCPTVISARSTRCRSMPRPSACSPALVEALSETDLTGGHGTFT